MGDMRRDLTCVGDIVEGVAAGPAEHELLPMQPGDMYQTYADATELERDVGLVPRVPLEDGLREFARRRKTCYGIG